MTIVTEIPPFLTLKGWSSHAKCKGMRVEDISRQDCLACHVRWECLWTALTTDDRQTDDAMFIRGGLSAHARDAIWYGRKSDKLAFQQCIVKAKELDRNDKRRKKAIKSNT